jgi:acyl-[acyl-carrier-protein] desaturase
MRAVCDVVKEFQMPGHGIENFSRKSVQIATAGIYDLRIHRDEVLAPVLRQLGVFERSDFSGEGEKARLELAEFLAALEVAASRFEARREALRERAERRSADDVG